MANVFVVSARRLSDDATVELVFAMGRTISFTDHTRAKTGLRSYDIATQRIEIDRGGMVRTTEDGGEVVIANLPKDIGEAGPWDGLVKDYAFKGQPAAIYWAPDNVWANMTLKASFRVEQPVANTVDGTITFPQRDPRADLDAPLVASTYLGDNVAPDGIEGDAELKGKRRLAHFGPCSNLTADKVNPQRLIFQLSSTPNPGVATDAVLCSRDGGAPLTPSTIRGTLASLQDPANIPPEGGYDLYAGPEGLFVRLCNMPGYRLTFDATTGAADADRTHAQIWKLLRTDWCGTAPVDIDAASVTAVDTAAPDEAGFLFRDETRREALDRVLASLSGFERQNLDGTWSVHRLEAPTGTPDLSLVMVTPDTAMKAVDRAITSPPAMARPSYAPDGAPPRKVNVRWGLNNTPMTPSDFAGSASTRLQDKFKDAWRVESSEDLTVWDPATQTGDFPDAPELTVETGYQPGADGRTSPHSAADAARLMSLYRGLKGQPEVGFRPLPTDPIVLPGKIAQLTYPAHGLDLGPKFIVLQGRLRAEGRINEASVLLGLQGAGATADSAAFTVDSATITADRG